MVKDFTAADRERVRTFAARRVATRIVGTDMHVVVVLADKVSAATLSERMRVHATWKKGDGSTGYWQRIRA